MKNILSDKNILSFISILSILLFFFNLFCFVDITREINNIPAVCEEGLNDFKTYADEAWLTIEELKKTVKVKTESEKVPLRRKRQTYENPTGVDEAVVTDDCREAGPPGPPGINGPPGENGHDGIPGAPGMKGLQLLMVSSTNECIICPTGPPGFPGSDGSVGVPGNPGAPGGPGPARIALPAPAGPPGNDGPKGPPGHIGPPGIPGQMSTRPVGLRGPAGASGPQGAKGVPGAAGVTRNNVMGPAGPAGKNGNPGLTGTTGPPGQIGAPGTPGSDAEYCPCGPRTIQEGGGAQSFEVDNAVGIATRNDILPLELNFVPNAVSEPPQQDSAPIHLRHKNFLWGKEPANIQPSGYRNQQRRRQ